MPCIAYNESVTTFLLSLVPRLGRRLGMRLIFTSALCVLSPLYDKTVTAFPYIEDGLIPMQSLTVWDQKWKSKVSCLLSLSTKWCNVAYHISLCLQRWEHKLHGDGSPSRDLSTGLQALQDTHEVVALSQHLQGLRVNSVLHTTVTSIVQLIYLYHKCRKIDYYNMHMGCNEDSYHSTTECSIIIMIQTAKV